MSSYLNCLNSLLCLCCTDYRERVAVDGDAWNLVDEALSKYMHSIGYIILAVLVVICEWYRQPRHTSKGVLKNEDMNCRLNTGN